MPYTIEGLEKSRKTGFRPRNIFGALLKEFLDLSDNLQILDAGCGTGFFTRIIAEQCKADVTGMDINEELLKGARRIAEQERLNIKFVKGDITDIPYENEVFDVVICDIMLECFEDITIPIREMKRVCKEGGIVTAIEPFYQSGFEYYPGMTADMRDLIIKYSRADRAFGLGPMLPEYFKEVGLKDIDMVSWLWGRIGYKFLEFETIEERLYDMQDNLERIKRFLPKSKSFNSSEKKRIIHFYEGRLKYFRENPDEMENDMSIKGLPVFIVRGVK